MDVTVDGYSLNKVTTAGTKNVFVSNQPKISFILQDDHGINLSSSNFEITIDSEPINRDDLLFSGAVENARSIGLTYYPQFTVGEHELTIRVEDVNGNLSTKDYTFKVESNFSLNIIGVFPNPFNMGIYPRCFVQFELTQPVNEEDFSASLYTLGGRKVRDFDGRVEFDAPLINVKSLAWDGTDRNGSEVANGVYFMKIRVKSSDTGKQEEKIVKIAKIR